MLEDLYTKILNLPEGGRPPHYYDLLAIDLFESDGNRIHSAGLQQMKTLREWQLHPDQAIANSVLDILSQVSAACTTLEVLARKEDYDRQLAETLGMDLSQEEAYQILTAETELRECPSCGTEVSNISILCIECGHNFETGERVQSWEEQNELRERQKSENRIKEFDAKLSKRKKIKKKLILIITGILILLTLSFTLSWIIPMLKNHAKYQKFIAEANTCREQQDWDGAISAFKKALDVPGYKSEEGIKAIRSQKLTITTRIKAKNSKTFRRRTYADAAQMEEDAEAAFSKGDYLLAGQLWRNAAEKFLECAMEGENTKIAGMEFVWIQVLNCSVGKYEVTNNEYREYKPNHDSGEFRKYYRRYSLNSDRQPAVNVNCWEAQEYAKWLTERERKEGRLPSGYKFRLPTKDEWTTFCQCGDNREYPWGSWPPHSGNAGNYSGNSSVLSKIRGYNDGYAVSCPVEKSWKNKWGLYGVGGNVWECTRISATDSYYDAWRGASWRDSDRDYLRSTYRSVSNASNRYDNCGFRLVLSR